ncbi:Hypothetical predicted protein [Paramuricea clavata]|uniref:Uncharacterized protein n=1 Tax=Paramuricea clavata TaxID=317549 RepID=A0A7D9ICC4_PARCT|nr:Hypothetical predicted protein [Paramuricea clavata]
MSKSRKHVRKSFSVEDLRKEAEEELDQEAVGAKLLNGIGSIDFKFADRLPSDVILCALIVKYGLTLVCAIANVVPSLYVLPVNFRRVVLNMICPELQEDDVNVIFESVSK